MCHYIGGGGSETGLLSGVSSGAEGIDTKGRGGGLGGFLGDKLDFGTSKVLFGQLARFMVVAAPPNAQMPNVWIRSGASRASDQLVPIIVEHCVAASMDLRRTLDILELFDNGPLAGL